MTSPDKPETARLVPHQMLSGRWLHIPQSGTGAVAGDYRGTRPVAACAYCGSDRVSPSRASCANCGAPRNDVAVASPAPIVYAPDQVTR